MPVPTIGDHQPGAFAQGGIKQSSDGKTIYFGNVAVPRNEVLRAYAGTLNPGFQAPPQRKFGNPAPLGLCGFALTTFLLSMINTNARGVESNGIVLGAALFYGGVVQFFAGMWEMAVENTFGATALSSYGGFWMSFAMIVGDAFGVRSSYTTLAEFQHALGFYLAGWMIFTVIMTTFTLKATWPFFGLFFFLSITFALLTAAHFCLDEESKPHRRTVQCAGGFGILTAFLAWYNAYAGIAEPTNSFFVPQGWNTPWSDIHKKPAVHELEIIPIAPSKNVEEGSVRDNDAY